MPPCNKSINLPGSSDTDIAAAAFAADAVADGICPMSVEWCKRRGAPALLHSGAHLCSLQ